jgi:hypothetical protein
MLSLLNLSSKRLQTRTTVRSVRRKSVLRPVVLQAALKLKAHDGNRTSDLFLTKEVLYRLSYMGEIYVHTPVNPSTRVCAASELFKMERETGFEPATPSLEGSRSTN